MNNFPRTLLLTSWNPDGRYAGGEALRRLLRELPRDRILWCSLKPAGGPLPPGLPAHCACRAPALHWRLRNSVLGYWWDFDATATHLARQAAAAARAFKTDLIWVLPELRAIPVAVRLARLLRLPVHATFYDAPESAGDICVPRAYFPRYMTHTRRLVRGLSSVDAVSDELLAHVRTLRPDRRLPGLVLPPGVPPDWMTSLGEVPPWGDEPIRKIGFCGSFRVAETQWRDWLALLADLPWRIELVAFASPETVPTTPLPANVSWRFLPYVEDERDIIRRFAAENVQACYLGLRRLDRWRLFNGTSLSSKLVTYTAAARPVIVDAPVESVAWRLVKGYAAGVRVDEDPGTAREAIRRLLADADAWRCGAAGAARMCRDAFDLTALAGQLTDRLATSAGKGAV